jgi:hypothetical protein
MPLLGVPGLRQLPGLLQVPNGPPGRAQRVFLLLPSAEVHSPSLLADQVRSPVLFCCCPILLPALLSCFEVFTTLNAVLLTHPSTGGSAWPSAWTSNSAYASALSSWQTQTTGAPAPFGAWGPGSNNSNSGPGGRGGWNGGNGVGPFGAGGPGNGWGPWSSRTSGDWTAGPWTSWWGGSDCPGSTWSGWTSDGTEAPWTAWSGCAASTIASSVVTTTVTTGSTTGVQTSTSYGIRVAAASMDASATSSGSSTGSEGAGARPTAMAGSALAAVGVLGAALLL